LLNKYTFLNTIHLEGVPDTNYKNRIREDPRIILNNVNNNNGSNNLNTNSTLTNTTHNATKVNPNNVNDDSNRSSNSETNDLNINLNNRQDAVIPINNFIFPNVSINALASSSIDNNNLDLDIANNNSFPPLEKFNFLNHENEIESLTNKIYTQIDNYNNLNDLASSSTNSYNVKNSYPHLW
jgi:hypothetical protein